MNPWGQLPVWLILLVDVLAVHRLTRLVVEDEIARPLRERAVRWGDDHAPWVSALLACRWCCAVHLAAAAVTARAVVPAVWSPAAYGLAVASAAVLVAGAERD